MHFSKICREYYRLMEILKKYYPQKKTRDIGDIIPIFKYMGNIILLLKDIGKITPLLICRRKTIPSFEDVRNTRPSSKNTQRIL